MTVFNLEAAQAQTSQDHKVAQCYYFRPDLGTARVYAIDEYLTVFLDWFSTAATIPSCTSFRRLSNVASVDHVFAHSEVRQRNNHIALKSALSIDAQEFFGGSRDSSTPLFSFGFRLALADYPRATPPDALQVPAVPQSRSDLPPHLTRDHASLLSEIHDARNQGNALWAWRDLEPILGASHSQLQRIARGSAMPAADVAQRIDDLHRFLARLKAVTKENDLAMFRALTTRRERDGLSAQEHLATQDFGKAFSAVMDAISPRRERAPIESRPLRWYDVPSVAMDEDGDSSER